MKVIKPTLLPARLPITGTLVWILALYKQEPTELKELQ